MHTPYPIANWNIAFTCDRPDFDFDDYAHGIEMDAPNYMPSGSVKSTKCGYIYLSVYRRKSEPFD